MSADKQWSWNSSDGKKLFVRQLRVEELPAVYALNKEQLQTEMAPIEQARAVLEHNSNTIWGVYRAAEDQTANDTLVGYLSFLMLNEDGASALKHERLDVLSPVTALLEPTGERPTVIYVWAIVARGVAGMAVPLTMQAMGETYAGVPLYGRAATEAGAKAMRSFGFEAVHKDRPDVGNLFRLTREGLAKPDDAKIVAPATRINVKVANESREIEQAFAIRAAVFMAEQNCPYDEEFDGNDRTATHVVGYIDGEPAATLRIRYFADFVKIERLAVLQRFRRSTIAMEIVRTALNFCRRKGYRRAYGHAQRRLVPFWTRFGFRPIVGASNFVFSDHEYVEMLNELAPHEGAITIGCDPYVLVRPEGHWDQPGILEHSAARLATNPH